MQKFPGFFQQVRPSCLLLPARSSRNLTNRSFGLIRLRRARRMFTKVRSTHRNVIYRRCPCGTATSMGDSLERRKRSLSQYLHFSLFFFICITNAIFYNWSFLPRMIKFFASLFFYLNDCVPYLWPKKIVCTINFAKRVSRNCIIHKGYQNIQQSERLRTDFLLVGVYC